MYSLVLFPDLFWGIFATCNWGFAPRWCSDKLCYHWFVLVYIYWDIFQNYWQNTFISKKRKHIQIRCGPKKTILIQFIFLICACYMIMTSSWLLLMKRRMSMSTCKWCKGNMIMILLMTAMTWKWMLESKGSSANEAKHRGERISCSFTLMEGILCLLQRRSNLFHCQGNNFNIFLAHQETNILQSSKATISTIYLNLISLVGPGWSQGLISGLYRAHFHWIIVSVYLAKWHPNVSHILKDSLGVWSRPYSYRICISKNTDALLLTSQKAWKIPRRCACFPKWGKIACLFAHFGHIFC